MRHTWIAWVWLLLPCGLSAADTVPPVAPTAPIDLDAPPALEDPFLAEDEPAPTATVPPSSAAAAQDEESLEDLPESAAAEAEAETEPSPPAVAAEEPEPARSTRQLDFSSPRYTRLRPNWAVSLHASLNAATVATAEVTTAPATQLKALSLAAEWQPEGLQDIGVVGIGPSFTYTFNTTLPDTVTAGGFAVWSVGGQIRYQARWFHEQILVPFAGYAAEQMTYRLVNANGRLTLSGPMFGAMLYLNALEPGAAGTFYSEQGVKRTYLVAEFRSRTGSDRNWSFSGTPLFFGLRIEF